MTRRLVLLRHGRTAWNHARRVQGQQDAELDEVGHAQALAVAPVMAALRPSLLWASDLSRARDTALAVAAATGLEPTYDARLREFSLGEREGLTHDEYAAADAEEFAAFRRGHLDSALGSEPTPAVRERMRAVLGDLLATLAPDQTGVAVSHGAAVRVADRRDARLARRRSSTPCAAWTTVAGWCSSSTPRSTVCTWWPTTAPSADLPPRNHPRISLAGPGWLVFRELLDGLPDSDEHGAVAQLVAHLHGMQRVRGSSPLSSTESSVRRPSGRSVCDGLDDQ